MRPAVYIIGTGPGDPGLISVRGLRALTEADVVIYDHLVHPRLLVGVLASPRVHKDFRSRRSGG